MSKDRKKKTEPVERPPKPATSRLPHLTPRRLRKACLILAVAALGLRMAGLSERSINIDEISTRQISRDLRVTGLLSECMKSVGRWISGRPEPSEVNPNRNLDLLDGRSPLSFVAISLFLDLNDSQAMLLFPAVLFGAATVGLLGWAGRVRFGWRVGMVAALLMLFSPPHIEYSQYARYYSFMVFLSLASYFYLELWLRMRRWRYLGLWLLCAILNGLSHPFAAFVVGFQGMIVLIALWFLLLRAVLGKAPRKTAAVTAAAIALVCAVAWIGVQVTGLVGIALGEIMDRPQWETQGIHYGWVFWRPYLVEMTGWPEGLLPIALVLLAAGLGVAWRRSKLFLVHLLFLLIVPIYVVYFLQPEHAFEIKYVAFALPFFLLTVAAGLVALWELVTQTKRVPERLRAPLGLVSGCLVLAVPLVGFNTFADQPVRREFRDVVRYLERVVRPQDTITFTLRDDETEFTYFVAERKTREQRRLEAEGATTETIRAALPFRQVGFRRHESWDAMKGMPYSRRLARPFWHVTGRLHGHQREEMTWAINTLSHHAFEYGYFFYSLRLVEMELSEVLHQARISSGQKGYPLPPGKMHAYRMSVYVPRGGVYYILSNQTVNQGMLRIEGMRPVRWIQLLPKPLSRESKTYLPEGRNELTLICPIGEIEKLNDFRLRVLAAVGDELILNAGQHDFISPQYFSFDYPTTYRGEFGISRRLFGAISFPIIIETSGRYEFAVTANHDRPSTNVVGLEINKNPFHAFVFDRRDNSLETQSMQVNLREGIWGFSIQNRWYRGLDEDERRGPVEDARKTTFVSRISIRLVKPARARE